MKIHQSLLIIFFACTLLNCNDDDVQKNVEETKIFTYDGNQFPLDKIMYDHEKFEENGLIDVTFTSTESGLIFAVLLSGDWNGKTVELTKLNSMKAWVVNLSLYDDENYYFNYYGDYGKIEDGTLYIKSINAETGEFDVKINLVSEGKEFGLTYNGKFDHSNLL